MASHEIVTLLMRELSSTCHPRTLSSYSTSSDRSVSRLNLLKDPRRLISSVVMKRHHLGRFDDFRSSPKRRRVHDPCAAPKQPGIRPGFIDEKLIEGSHLPGRVTSNNTRPLASSIPILAQARVDVSDYEQTDTVLDSFGTFSTTHGPRQLADLPGDLELLAQHKDSRLYRFPSSTNYPDASRDSATPVLSTRQDLPAQRSRFFDPPCQSRVLMAEEIPQSSVRYRDEASVNFSRTIALKNHQSEHAALFSVPGSPSPLTANRPQENIYPWQSKRHFGSHNVADNSCSAVDLSNPQLVGRSNPVTHAPGHARSENAPFAHIPLSVRGIVLVPVADLPERYRTLFSFPLFNAIQSKCFHQVYNTNDNIVLAAPTGSGKTVVMELAICRLLGVLKDERFKVVYQAPTKSLCSERFRDWQNKFARLNLKCAELTGDTDHSQLRSVQSSQIIITTPEKWDSMTRKWKDHMRLMQLVKLFLIDEVHILKETRGATLEAVVSRMKNIGSNVRFVALSATVPNSEDIATWLGKDATNQHVPAHREHFGEDFRPVKLQKFVYGYHSTGNDFVLDKICGTKFVRTVMYDVLRIMTDLI